MEVRKINNSGGFTLLELIVVLTIGATLVMFGVPAFQSVIADQRSTSTANELIESLILARSEAIKRGRYVSVCKSTDGANCTAGADWNDGWIVFSNVSSATPGTVDGGDEVLRVRQAVPGALSIDSTGNIGAFISFRPVGTSGSQVLNFSGTLMLCDEHGNTVPRGLIVSPSGRIQVSRDVDHLDQPLVCA
jgi:type IV fimbrial biogenesis protein FimT